MAVQKGKETQKTTAGGKGILQWLVIAVCIALTVCGAVVLKAELAAKEERTRMAQSKVVLYEGPKSLRDATEADLENSSEKGRDIALLHCTDTQVTINGADCFVYDTNVNHTRQWVSNYYPPMSRTPVTYFDFEGTVEVQVTVPNVELESVKISPLSYEIEPVVDAQAHTVTFRIDTPDAYTLQFNGAPERAVHIFRITEHKRSDIARFCLDRYRIRHALWVPLLESPRFARYRACKVRHRKAGPRVSEIYRHYSHMPIFPFIKITKILYIIH